jgi:hypothetical protein
MKRSFIIMVTMAMLAFVGPVHAQTADIPPSLAYQGHLTDAGGVEVNDTVQIEVRLYDSLIAGLGQGVTNSHVVYAESHPAVSVEEGNFSVAIGEGIPLDAKWTGLPDVAQLLSSERLFLELRVNGELMTPRQRMGSVPAALRAHHAKVADEVVNIPSMDSSQMPAYSAARLAEGTLDAARIPGLNASVITGQLVSNNLPYPFEVDWFDPNGHLTESQLPYLSAATITSGIVGTSYIPESEVFLTDDIAIKIGTLIDGQHLNPPTGFDFGSSTDDCHYAISPVETSGAVQGIDKMIVYLESNGNLVCRVCERQDDDLVECIMCNAHYMILCKRGS